MPSLTPVTMTYGDYNFGPVPIISWNKSYNTNPDGTPIGLVHNITLEGVLTSYPTGVAGYPTIDGLQDDLREGLKNDCQLFEVKCGSDTLISAVPNVKSIQFAPTRDNWVYTTNYTIDLEFYEEPYNGGEDTEFVHKLKERVETWDVEFDDSTSIYHLDLDGTPDDNSYVMRLTHNVSAVGQRHCNYGALPSDPSITGSYVIKEAWEQARDWVLPRLGYSTQAFTLIDRDVDYSVAPSGAINIISNTFENYNHVRSQNINETDGSFSVTETWLVVNPTGAGIIAGNAIEDFTITVKNGNFDTPLTNVIVEGTVQGLESKTFGTVSGDFEITTNKYDAALSYWNTLKAKLFPRAQKIGDDEAFRSMNTFPLNSSVAHNPPQGIITYAVEYDDRPCNFITGALMEVMTIVDNNPTDVFATLTVLGRARGPVLQEIGTVTASTRDVSIELVMQPPSGCTSISSNINAAPTTNVDNILCDFETVLTDAYSQVFKHADNATWNFKTGRYSRSVSWTYTSCTGDAPNTSFC